MPLNLNICCVIDSLGSGGAQRQMAWLVRSMIEGGSNVRLITYFRKFDHFLPDIRNLGVEPEYVESGSRFSRVWSTRKLIRKKRPDCIISFLNTPNMLAVLSSLPPKKIPVVVSERSLDVNGKTKANRVRFNLFRFASRVVTNSHSQAEFIRQNYSFLNEKIEVIRNSVDLKKFSPRQSEVSGSKSRKILVAASVIKVKNTHRLIRALKLANSELENPITIDWFGNDLFVDGKPTAGSSFFLEAKALVERLGMEQTFRMFPPVADVHERMKDYDAICLASLYEGCPNVICEAMACGRPVLASKISDVSIMLGDCPFLFEPTDEADIARKLVMFAKTPSDELATMGTRNRAEAEKQFSPHLFSESYHKLISELV